MNLVTLTCDTCGVVIEGSPRLEGVDCSRECGGELQVYDEDRWLRVSPDDKDDLGD